MTANTTPPEFVNVPIEKIKPNPNNPRIQTIKGMPFHTDLTNSITEFGYVVPIIWNKRTGYIVSGHQRFQVLKDIAEAEGTTLTDIQCIVVDMDEHEQDLFMIASNKISGQWDRQKLATVFDGLDETMHTYTGFREHEIQSLQMPQDPEESDDGTESDQEDEQPVNAVSFICRSDAEKLHMMEKFHMNGSIKKQYTVKELKGLMG